jgi:hypothetical protein
MPIVVAPEPPPADPDPVVEHQQQPNEPGPI